MTESELAYVAGFFDGEGSITIWPKNKSPRGFMMNHTLQAAIGNTDPRVLLWLRSHFGGSFTYRAIHKKNHRHVAHWSICAAKALVFLEAIRPFLRMKVDQADVAIAYQRSKRQVGPRPVTEEQFAWREVQRKHIAELNARSWITNEQADAKCPKQKYNQKFITFNGETKSATEWATALNMMPAVFLHRLRTGWTIERAITQPKRKSPVARTA